MNGRWELIFSVYPTFLLKDLIPLSKRHIYCSRCRHQCSLLLIFFSSLRMLTLDNISLSPLCLLWLRLSLHNLLVVEIWLHCMSWSSQIAHTVNRFASFFYDVLQESLISFLYTISCWAFSRLSALAQMLSDWGLYLFLRRHWDLTLWHRLLTDQDILFGAVRTSIILRRRCVIDLVLLLLSWRL
jgi:hypothetical protein